jgi:hypothetical protein
MQFLPVSCHFISLGSYCERLTTKHPLRARGQVSEARETACDITVSFRLFPKFPILGRRQQYTRL